MTHAILKMHGKEFVLVPKAEYRRLTKNSQNTRRKSRKPRVDLQDAGDIAEARRRLAAGKLKPYSELRKELGL